MINGITTTQKPGPVAPLRRAAAAAPATRMAADTLNVTASSRSAMPTATSGRLTNLVGKISLGAFGLGAAGVIGGLVFGAPTIAMAAGCLSILGMAGLGFAAFKGLKQYLG